jgi:hypothetical protein
MDAASVNRKLSVKPIATRPKDRDDIVLIELCDGNIENMWSPSWSGNLLVRFIHEGENWTHWDWK